METISIIIAGAFSLMILERIIPDQKLPDVKKWWQRVWMLNFIQASVVYIGGLTWEVYLRQFSILRIETYFSKTLSVALAYILITFVFYWWHRWRHTVNFLWLKLHQVHHSPQRIETITSFYKHPLEIFCNSILISAILFSVLGLSLKTGAIVTIVTAYAEFFYHMNVRTPQWVGYFIQRPEMHRIHHQRSVHFSNFADLPFWDILFGTFKNPKTYQGKCGYHPTRERKLFDMLCFKNVNDNYYKDREK